MTALVSIVNYSSVYCSQKDTGRREIGFNCFNTGLLPHKKKRKKDSELAYASNKFH